MPDAVVAPDLFPEPSRGPSGTPGSRRQAGGGPVSVKEDPSARGSKRARTKCVWCRVFVAWVPPQRSFAAAAMWPCATARAAWLVVVCEFLTWCCAAGVSEWSPGTAVGCYWPLVVVIGRAGPKTSRRRLTHNASEQRRVKRISAQVDKLREVLRAADRSGKNDKCSVLAATVDYVSDLEAEVKRIREQLLVQQSTWAHVAAHPASLCWGALLGSGGASDGVAPRPLD